MRAVQIQDRTGFCIAFHGCKILNQVQDDSAVGTFDNNRRAAFTLAEVLITLGIIGVVAAMTIPTLISNYQNKALKTQFMNKYATINQAVLFAKNENGLTNIQSYCTELDLDNLIYYNETKCKEIFNKYFKVVGKCKYKDDIVTYNKQNTAYVDRGAVIPPTKLLADGSCYDIRINSKKLGFTFDVNGPEKGPNALGHDIFSFWLDKNDYLQPIKQNAVYAPEEIENELSACNELEGNPMWVCKATANQKGNPCNKTSNQQGNGIGCSWFALHDICPDDETKGYWDCLP